MSLRIVCVRVGCLINGLRVVDFIELADQHVFLEFLQTVFFSGMCGCSETARLCARRKQPEGLSINKSLLEVIYSMLCLLKGQA